MTEMPTVQMMVAEISLHGIVFVIDICQQNLSLELDLQPLLSFILAS